jgi:DNA helicase IV
LTRDARDTTAKEIASEQRFVDAVYARLDEAARSARILAAEGHDRGRLGHEGGLVERDAMVFQAAKRIADLDAASEGLVFGRLDLRGGVTRYVGRIGLRDAEREVMLIDWRAPAASVFYQATAAEPSGVVRRRVLRSRASTVVGVEDDLLDADSAPDDMVVVGEGVLLAQLSRARDAHMHSVVATIQKEQDEAIRAPSRGVTTIGGGPGTGKTVVALHRAAYLLYTNRRRFSSGGVLVVGPSDVFMGYIARVLPSLGETSVTLRSIGEVVDGIAATRHDEPHVVAIKGSARMRRVLARAVRDAVPGEPQAFRLFWRDEVLELDARALRSLRRRLLGSGQKRNRVWAKVRGHLLDVLWRQVRGERGIELGRQAFDDELASTDAFTDFADAWWPPLDATKIEGWLHDRHRLSRYAGQDLTPAEVEVLCASWERHGDVSVEDVPLVDELRYLLGDVPLPEERARRDRVDGVSEAMNDLLSDEPRQLMSFEAAQRGAPTSRTEDDSYAHVLVDEAQDLSPMQWRMLGRRGRHASWTVVGDPAQSSWPHPDEAAQARVESLGDLPVHAFRLSTNYRNSAEVFGFAARVARIAISDPDLPDAVRRTGRDPEHRVVERLDPAVPEAVTQVAESVEGTVAVVASVALRARVAEQLGDLLETYGGRVSVFDGLATKGLEFDGVVVVEPGQIVAEAESGWRTLYVILTRAVQRLVTVGTDDNWLRRVESGR